MNKRHTRLLVLAVVALASAMAAHVLAQGQQPPKVQIPQSGVPQIMTIEGAFVRAAYNNEGYVILGTVSQTTRSASRGCCSTSA